MGVPSPTTSPYIITPRQAIQVLLLTLCRNRTLFNNIGSVKLRYLCSRPKPHPVARERNTRGLTSEKAVVLGSVQLNAVG